jgi:hypothetical protein
LHHAASAIAKFLGDLREFVEQSVEVVLVDPD